MSDDINHLPAEIAAGAAPAVGQTAAGNTVFFDGSLFERCRQVGDIMAAGRCTVPKHLQGNPADCFAIAAQAMRWGLDPYAVAQKTHIVNGALGYEAQLVMAVLYAIGPLDGRLAFDVRGAGNDMSVQVSGRIKGRAEVLTLPAAVRLGDQAVKNSPLWKTDPALQLCYLGAKKWARLHCPDVLMGVYTPDELEDAAAHRGPDNAINVTPRPATAAPTSRLGGFAAGAAPAAQAVEADEAPMEPDPDAFWKRARGEGRYDFRGRSARRWAVHAAALAGTAPDLDELAAFRAANGPKMRDLPAALRDELAAALDNIATSYAPEGVEDDDFPGDAA